MKIKINSIYGKLIFEGDFSSIADAVASAIKSKINLSCADLSYADLSYADLSYADLSCADLSYADLSYGKGKDLVIAKTRILPDGDIIGWKKCRSNKIVKLLIPSDAKRSHAFGRKCRAEFAKVLEISDNSKSATSNYDSDFIYKVGQIVKPTEKFSEDWMEECASGIHFYITKIEANNH